MAITRDQDLGTSLLEDLSWTPDERLNSLEKVCRHVSGEAYHAIAWYLDKKRPKRIGARALRLGAIVATTVAGIIPLLAQISTSNGQPQIAPAWASVALVLAVALVGLDRFLGLSSAWMRFLTTEIQIRNTLQAFQLDWEIQRARWKGAAPSDEQVQEMLGRCKAFLVQVNALLEQEMAAWIQEFQTALRQLDDAAKSRAETEKLGGVTIVVSNGEQCTNGWDLSIDGGSPRHCMGKTAALRDLLPGIHTVRVEGKRNGNDVQAEGTVVISAGETTRLTLEVQ